MSTEETPLTASSSIERSFVVTKLIAFESAEEIARNWKLLLFTGICNVIFGSICLLNPFAASEAVAVVYILTVIGSGVVNLIGVCSPLSLSDENSPHYSKTYMFWIGVLEILLGIFLWQHPLFTLAALTVTVAIVFMMLGLMQMALSQDAEIGGAVPRGVLLIFGCLTVALSVMILIEMPLSSWFTIGTILGVNLINLGCNRIFLGFQGRRLSILDPPSSNDYLALSAQP